MAARRVRQMVVSSYTVAIVVLYSSDCMRIGLGGLRIGRLRQVVVL